MRMNFRQKELILEFYDAIREKFPETEFISVTEGPENPNDLWMNITAPADEDTEDELIEFAGEKGTDILLDYGYWGSCTGSGEIKALYDRQLCC